MVKEFLKENALVVVIGTVLTFIAMNYMEGVRGDIAIGGEVFILPMLLFADEFKNFLFRRFVNAVTREFMRTAPVKEA